MKKLIDWLKGHMLGVIVGVVAVFCLCYCAFSGIRPLTAAPSPSADELLESSQSGLVDRYYTSDAHSETPVDDAEPVRAMPQNGDDAASAEPESPAPAISAASTPAATAAPSPSLEPTAAASPSPSLESSPSASASTVPTRSDPAEAATPVATPEPASTDEQTCDYIGNKNSGIFHYPSCSSVKSMKESNKFYFTGTRSEITGMGYKACQRCKP